MKQQGARVREIRKPVEVDAKPGPRSGAKKKAAVLMLKCLYFAQARLLGRDSGSFAVASARQLAVCRSSFRGQKKPAEGAWNSALGDDLPPAPARGWMGRT